jgi:predicted flavoprotein YhiN
VKIFASHDIGITPLTAANCGWEVEWSTDLLEIAEGLPLKNIAVSAEDSLSLGELVITKYGLEGGPIYKLGPAIRSLPSPEITIDFKPTFTSEQLIAKMESAKKDLIKEATIRWKLNPATHALLADHYRHTKPISVEDLAKTIKNFRIPLTQSRPIDEAISSAGGIKWSELDANLMLKKLPGVYCAGEMLDWEAPTGGYLLQACFATGDWAGRSCLEQTADKLL